MGSFSNGGNAEVNHILETKRVTLMGQEQKSPQELCGLHGIGLSVMASLTTYYAMKMMSNEEHSPDPFLNVITLNAGLAEGKVLVGDLPGNRIGLWYFCQPCQAWVPVANLHGLTGPELSKIVKCNEMGTALPDEFLKAPKEESDGGRA